MDETKDRHPKDGEVVEDETDPSGSSSDEADRHHFTATLVITPDESRLAADDRLELEDNPPIYDKTSTSSHHDDFPVTKDTDKRPSLTEGDMASQPSLPESEADASRHDSLARQLELVRKEAVMDGDSDLEAAAHCLRHSSPRDNSGRQDVVVMEMETFQRSSTRRDSFVLAIEGGEGREMDTSVVSGASVTVTTTDGQSRDTQGQTMHTDVEGLISEVEKLFGEDKGPWETIRGQYCEGGRRWVVCGTVLLLLAVVSAIILIPQSMVYVEYYQMALARSRVTGRVDRGRTLYSGCYLLFPDTELVLFKATAHHVHSQLQVTSADGLSLGLQLALQYFIKGEELGLLHVQYGEQYEEVVHSVVDSEVQNSVVHFTLDQYRLHRDTLEKAIHRRLALRLQGDCCPRPCMNASQWPANVNCSTCNASPNCSHGLHMTLQAQHVQLGAIDIPEEVNERYLRFTLLQVEAEQERLVQESTVEKKRTELLTKDLRNQAHEVLEAAQSTSRKIRLEAEAIAQLRRQTAYNQALKQLLTSLNITANDQRLSVLLLQAYRQAENPVFFLQGLLSC